MIYSLILDHIGNALFYVALWMDEEIAFLRLTCESQVREFRVHILLPYIAQASYLLNAKQTSIISLRPIHVSSLQGIEFLLDRVIDKNKKRSTFLRRISVAKTKMLKTRADAALAVSMKQSVQAAGEVAVASARGKKARAKQRQLLQEATKASGAGGKGAKPGLTPEAQRALADVAAHNGTEAGGGRGDPYKAALYMKLCERYDGMSVAPSKLINGGDKQAAAIFTSLKAQSAEVARVLGSDPEGTVDAEAEREVIKRDIAQRKRGFIKCGGGGLNLFKNAEGAVDSLDSPESLNLLKRGWLLRGFLSALWGSRVWFQHTYLSVFTKVCLFAF